MTTDNTNPNMNTHADELLKKIYAARDQGLEHSANAIMSIVPAMGAGHVVVGLTQKVAATLISVTKLAEQIRGVLEEKELIDGSPYLQGDKALERAMLSSGIAHYKDGVLLSSQAELQTADALQSGEWGCIEQVGSKYYFIVNNKGCLRYRHLLREQNHMKKVTRRTNRSRQKRTAEIFRRKRRQRLLSKRRRALRDAGGFVPVIPLPAPPSTPTIPGFLPSVKPSGIPAPKMEKKKDQKIPKRRFGFASLFERLFRGRGQLR